MSAYILERNEDLWKVLTILNANDNKSSDILKDLEKILKIKIFSYFNEKKIKNNLPLKRLAEDNNLF